jgi:tetratricopeptide (TPR) repeat protein
MIDERYTDDERTALLAEARYHLGRVLYEGELDFNRAVSELEEAVALDPTNIAAHYHLGKAIRILVDRNMLQRAADVLKRYLLAGAPLGHEEEVRAFLGTRAPGGGAGLSTTLGRRHQGVRP